MAECVTWLNVYLEAGMLGALATIGDNIKRLRPAAGFDTQLELARALGVSQQQVSDWENNRYKLLDTATLLALAKLLKCSIDAILDGVDPDYDPKQERSENPELLLRPTDPAIAEIFDQASEALAAGEAIRAGIPEILAGDRDLDEMAADIGVTLKSLRDTVRIAFGFRGGNVDQEALDALSGAVRASRAFLEAAKVAIHSRVKFVTAKLELERMERDFDDQARHHGLDPGELRRQFHAKKRSKEERKRRE